MIRRHTTFLRLSLMVADALVAAAAFGAVSLVRFGPEWEAVWRGVGLPVPIGMAAWAAIWVSVLWLTGLYRLRAHWSIQADLVALLRATLVVATAVFAVLFAVNIPDVSRLFLVLLFGAQLGVAVAFRLTIRGLFSMARERGLNTRYMLVVGTNPIAESFARLVTSHRELGLRVIGHLGERRLEYPAVSHPILGEIDDIEAVLHSNVVDEVAICLPLEDWPLVEAITRICAEEGRAVRVPADGAVPHIVGADIEQFGPLVIQSIVYGPDRAISLLLKRVVDVTGALMIGAVLAPILAAIGLSIWLRDARPIMFRQPRVGLHGRMFTVIKFRTMVPGAEHRLHELAEHNEILGHAFKVTRDPRVTRTGAFLRRTSLDELPQLWNVIRGDMSLVGPRPPLPAEVALYDVWHRRRLSMKPGITGLWQVTNRRNPDFDRWVSTDLEYIDRWSLWLDLKIMARTLPAMLQGR